MIADDRSGDVVIERARGDCRKNHRLAIENGLAQLIVLDVAHEVMIGYHAMIQASSKTLILRLQGVEAMFQMLDWP